MIRGKREKRDEDFEVLCALHDNASIATMKLQGGRSLDNGQDVLENLDEIDGGLRGGGGRGPLFKGKIVV